MTWLPRALFRGATRGRPTAPLSEADAWQLLFRELRAAAQRSTAGTGEPDQTGTSSLLHSTLRERLQGTVAGRYLEMLSSAARNMQDRARN